MLFVCEFVIRDRLHLPRFNGCFYSAPMSPKKNGIEFDKYVTDPYKEYLAGKSKIIVTAKPRKPIDLARIKKYRPIDVPTLLNLEAGA